MNISMREELSQRGLQSNLKIKVDKLDEEPVSKKELLKVKEDITSDQSQLAQMTLAIDELVKYLNNLAEVNLMENLSNKMAVDN